MTSTHAPDPGPHGRYRAAVDRLNGAQKRAKGGPAYTIYVNRWLGGRLAALAYTLGLTPNVVTVISAICSLLGIATLALDERAALLAAPLLLAGYALDSADGQLARLRGGGSLVGEWLDHLVDAVKIASLHLAVLIHLYRFADVAEAWLLVPIGFTVSNITSYSAYLLGDLLRRGATQTGTLAPAAYEPASPLNAILKLPVDFGVLCLALAFVRTGSAFLVAYGLLFVCHTAYVALAAAKAYRDLTRMVVSTP
jgi:phosphatidylglycerophosphate synthase